MKPLLLLLACILPACEKQPPTPHSPNEPPVPAAASPAKSVPDLTLPNAIVGKWKKEGLTHGWHVFETPTHHYWTDGKKRNPHRISLKEENGTWYLYWWNIERPREKVEISQKDGTVIMRTIPTTRGGFFGPHFTDSTYVKMED